MTKKYNQLTLPQRYKIDAHLESGKSQSEISILLGVHKSTVSRELSRNVPKRGFGPKVYRADKAQLKPEKRHTQKRKYSTFSLPLKLQMKDWMDTKRYSIELISAQWKKDNVEVSHECMYQFIWKCKHTNKEENKAFKEVHKFLKHGKRRFKRGNYIDSRGLIPNRVSIENRSEIVDKRERFGDVEVDLIMGKDHKIILISHCR